MGDAPLVWGLWFLMSELIWLCYMKPNWGVEVEWTLLALENTQMSGWVTRPVVGTDILFLCLGLTSHTKTIPHLEWFYTVWAFMQSLSGTPLPWTDSKIPKIYLVIFLGNLESHCMIFWCYVLLHMPQLGLRTDKETSEDIYILGFHRNQLEKLNKGT